MGSKFERKERTPEEVVADQTELEKFLLDIDCLDALDKWVNKPNIFGVLSIEGNEIRHSNFLAWLLDPNEVHGLGDYFLKKILQNVVKTYPLDERPISLFELDKIELDDATVLRENNHIDIMVVSKTAKLLFVIENKLFSGEHDNQLNRYAGLTKELYPGYRKVYAYLSLYGERPSEESWAVLSYDYIYAVLKSILSSREMTNRCRIYIEDYLDILGSILMNDKELKEVCKDIYEKHRKALDILYDNIPTRQSILDEKVTALLKPYIDSGRIIQLKSIYTEIRFTTKVIREKVGLFGDNSWVDSGDLLVFYTPISNTDNRYICMTLGPGNQKCREVWFNYLKETKLFACRSKELTEKYKDVATHRIRDADITDEEYIELHLQKLKDYLDNLDEVEKIILGGPDFKEE